MLGVDYQLVCKIDVDGDCKYLLWVLGLFCVIFLAFLVTMALGMFENDQKVGIAII